MNRLVLIVFLFFVWSLCGQNQNDDVHFLEWQKKQKSIEFEKEDSYKGPNDWDAPRPGNMSKIENIDPSKLKDIPYNSKAIDQDRKGDLESQNQNNNDEGLEADPEIAPPQPIEIETEEPNNPSSVNFNLPSIPDWIWKMLLLILVAALLIYLVYLYVNKPSNQKVSTKVTLDDYWNPELVEKSEIQQRLDLALSKNDFREAVRIYYLFILKNLNEKEWIHWKKDKTNRDYQNEMRQRSGYNEFAQCTLIFDRIFYGNYLLDQNAYLVLEKTLKSYYQKTLDL